MAGKKSLKKDLTSRQICDIIKYCKESNVVLFELGELKIKFCIPSEAYIYEEEPAVDKDVPEQINQDTLLQDEIDVRQEQLAMADVENPELYDELRELNELEGSIDAEREYNDSE